MNRLERLHALSETIRRSSPTPVSAASLAERFDVSARTIERDLAALRSAGVPLYAEPGRSGGQVRLDTPGQSLLSLSASEVSALLIALAAAGPGMPFADSGESAAHRLLDSLGPTTRQSVEQLRASIRVRERPQPSIRVRRTVEEAVRKQLVVNIDYTRPDATATTRSVDPVGFHQGAEAWHLIAWCHLRGAGRLFRLDRISGARLTRTTATAHDLEDTLGWVPSAVVAP